MRRRRGAAPLRGRAGGLRRRRRSTSACRRPRRSRRCAPCAPARRPRRHADRAAAVPTRRCARCCATAAAPSSRSPSRRRSSRARSRRSAPSARSARDAADDPRRGVRDGAALMARVIVVGGGVAGLGCAWRLAARRPRGRGVRARGRAGRPHAQRAARRVPARPRRAVRRERLPEPPRRAAPARARGRGAAGRAHRERGAARRPARARRLRLAPRIPALATALAARRSSGSRAIPLELWRHRRLLDPLRPERAAELDGEDLAAWARRTVGDEVLEYAARPRAFASTFDSDPEHLSGAFALLAMRFVAGGFRAAVPRGRARARDAGPRARASPCALGYAVTSVETDAGSAHVRYVAPSGERMREADAVVVAVPGSLAARLCPKLTARRARLLRAGPLRAAAPSSTCSSTRRRRRCRGTASPSRGARGSTSTASRSTTGSRASRRPAPAS